MDLLSLANDNLHSSPSTPTHVPTFFFSLLTHSDGNKHGNAGSQPESHFGSKSLKPFCSNVNKK